MKPEIKIIKEKKFIGQKVEMSFAKNRTQELWKKFGPRKKEIKNVIGIELYSIELYPESFFDNFNPTITFQKWAAVEVSNYDQIPEDMDKLSSPEGLYAIFLYKGLASEGHKFYQYIFKDWIPKSDYVLDDRPHFAVMGEKYKNNEPNSEEEIWIPIKKSN